MKIAVSGATGFIGHHVVAELERHLISPVLMCRPSSNNPLSKHRIVPIDIKVNPVNAFELLGRPDVFIHLAWGGLPHFKSKHHVEVELPAHYLFLKGLIESGLKRLIVTGTCNEYGMQSGALSENLPAMPNHYYSIAKNTLRQKIQSLKNERAFCFAWARLFYMFGEGQYEYSLMPQLRKAVEKKLPIFDMSGGEQLRDYLPVTEVAKQLVRIAVSENDLGIVNVCSGVPVSVRHLVEGWIRDNNWNIKLNLGYFPYADYEPLEFWGDNQKLMAAINAMDGGRTLQSKSI